MKAIRASNKDILRIFLLKGDYRFYRYDIRIYFLKYKFSFVKTIVVNTNVLTNFTIEVDLLKTYIELIVI